MKERRDLSLFGGEPLGDLLTGLLRPLSVRMDALVPSIKIDVTENEEAYEVSAELPGVKKDDIDLRVDGNLVTLAAHIENSREEKDGGRPLLQERQYGAVSRTFSLAKDVDQARAVARFDNGVLHLTLPKRVGATSNRIQVG